MSADREPALEDLHRAKIHAGYMVALLIQEGETDLVPFAMRTFEAAQAAYDAALSAVETRISTRKIAEEKRAELERLVAEHGPESASDINSPANVARSRARAADIRLRVAEGALGPEWSKMADDVDASADQRAAELEP